MMSKKIALALVVTATLLSGCASRIAPIENVNQTVSQNYSDSQMKQAITQAGAAYNWVITPAGPGVMNGHLTQRTHSVDIRISYTSNSYQIQYVSSQNLSAGSGKIHRNYNRWVHNLSQGIQTRLAVNAVK